MTFLSIQTSISYCYTTLARLNSLPTSPTTPKKRLQTLINSCSYLRVFSWALYSNSFLCVSLSLCPFLPYSSDNIICLSKSKP